MTNNYAVLGSPIAHSKSPAIHQAAFEFYGLDANYSRFELAAGLSTFLEAKDSSWKGFSVTMPLKQQALDLAQRADPLAIATQSANTLVRTESGWDAYNTDVMGIQKAFAGAKFSSVCVLGTGATARSAIVAMLEKGRTVSIWGRDEIKVQRLAGEFGLQSISKLHTALSQPAVISTVVANSIDDQIKSNYSGHLLDVVYSPWPTLLAQHFPADRVVSGLEMLIWQAVGQQRLFFGNDLDEPLTDELNLVRTVRAALNMAK